MGDKKYTVSVDVQKMTQYYLRKGFRFTNEGHVEVFLFNGDMYISADVKRNKPYSMDHAHWLPMQKHNAFSRWLMSIFGGYKNVGKPNW